MKKYYVVKIRTTCNDKAEETVFLFDKEEALKNNWINSEGNRIWVEPPEEERTRTSVTSVYGFDDLNKATEFWTMLSENQIGMTVYG